jgi:hypothetical protein
LPPLARNRVAIGLLIALLAGSFGLKALKHAKVEQPMPSGPGALQIEIVRNLEAQGFSTRFEVTRLHGTIVHATKGDCRLSVRDADHAEWEKGIYERDAAAIGPLRYLMAGRSYSSPPSLAILLARHRARLAKGLRLASQAPAALAFASSRQCGVSDFGLSNMSVPV